jgi:hypothetical protein
MNIDTEEKDEINSDRNSCSQVNSRNTVANEEMQIEQTEAEVLEEHEECPSCFEGEHRWIYECGECSFIGCYDEVYENGCYMGSPDERQCPECNSTKRMRIGKVGKGSVEEYDW